MVPAPQSSDSPFSFQNQNSKASLSKSAIIWLVVLACIVVISFIIVSCLLCRCRRKRENGQRSRGYSVHDGRNEFHPWNRNASPLPPAPAYSGHGDAKAAAEQTSVLVPSRATIRPAVMEPMVVEEAANDTGFARNSRKASRYYGGLGARFSRMSHIGRAL